MLHVAAALKHTSKVCAVKAAGTEPIEAAAAVLERSRRGHSRSAGHPPRERLESWEDSPELEGDADVDRSEAVFKPDSQDVALDTSSQRTLDGHDIAALYERHAPAIYAHCRRLLGSATAGRDALQESFVRVLQHHRVLGPGDQALRYLYRTSTNVCINLLRQRSVRERAAPLIAAQINAAQSNQPVPGDREFVRLLLEQCDETAVAVALMHFVDGMTQVEVAATLGITRRTVYNRIRRIERLAADLLEPTTSAEKTIDQAAR